MKKSSDINQIAARITEAATNPDFQREKNPAAVALGRLGGLKGGKARAAKLSAKKKKEISAHALKVRWDRYRAKQKNKLA